MSTGRFATPGKTRSCPHCRATILESAAVCPGCNHHLRFDPSGANQRGPADTPLRVEGTLRHASGSGGAWEYSVVLAIRNERGEEIARQVVGVGALQGSESRTFTLAVEVFKPAELREPKPQAAEPAARGAPDPRSPDPRAAVRPGTPGTPGARPEPLRPPGLQSPAPGLPSSAPGRPAAALPQPGPSSLQPGASSLRPGSSSAHPGAASPRPGSPMTRPASPARPGSTLSPSGSSVAQGGNAPAKPGAAPAQPGSAATPVKPSAPSSRLPFSKTPFLGRGK